MLKRLLFFRPFLFSIQHKNLSIIHSDSEKYRELRAKRLTAGILLLLLLPANLIAQEAISATKLRRTKNTASQGQSVTKTNSSTVKSLDVKSLDEYLRRAAVFGFSGAVLVAQDNKIILNKGYGLANRESVKPITTETVFDIGSITKQFTAAAIMKLEERGKLSVQDSIPKYFDNVPEDKRGITIHHLLTHSSGAASYSGDDYELISRDTFVERFMRAPLRFKPGEKYAYSNSGYSLLAVIIEKVSCQPYESFIREHLLLPAGIEKTGYTAPYWGKEFLARGYRGVKNEGTPLDYAWWGDGPSWNLRGNGGLLSTLDDLYRWHLALGGNKILSESSKRKMFSQHVATATANSYYGYGWSISQTPHGRRLVSHTGSNGIFGMNFRRYVDEGVVVIFATNDYRYDWEVDKEVERRLFGGAGQLPPLQAITIPAADLSRYAGTYKLPSGATVKITILDGLLAINPAQKEIGFMLTKFPPVKGMDRLNNIETVASRVIFGMVNKDFEPLRQILQEQIPFQAEKEFWEQALNGWQDSSGKLQEVKVVGSQQRGADIATYVLLQFERGTRMIGFLQNMEGKFFISANPPPIFPDLYRLVPQSRTEFTAYNLPLSSGTSIHFQLAGDRVTGLTIRGENGDIQAQKVS